jgi:hypothetical protein
MGNLRGAVAFLDRILLRAQTPSRPLGSAATARTLAWWRPEFDGSDTWVRLGSRQAASHRLRRSPNGRPLLPLLRQPTRHGGQFGRISTRGGRTLKTACSQSFRPPRQGREGSKLTANVSLLLPVADREGGVPIRLYYCSVRESSKGSGLLEQRSY